MNPDPPNDFEETVLETFHEMESEEQVTMILAELPADVIQAIEDFEIEHSVPETGSFTWQLKRWTIESTFSATRAPS